MISGYPYFWKRLWFFLGSFDTLNSSKNAPKVVKNWALPIWCLYTNYKRNNNIKNLAKKGGKLDTFQKSSNKWMNHSKALLKVMFKTHKHGKIHCKPLFLGELLPNPIPLPSKKQRNHQPLATPISALLRDYYHPQQTEIPRRLLRNRWWAS